MDLQCYGILQVIPNKLLQITIERDMACGWLTNQQVLETGLEDISSSDSNELR